MRTESRCRALAKCSSVYGDMSHDQRRTEAPSRDGPAMQAGSIWKDSQCHERMAEESGSLKSDDLNEIRIVTMRQYLLQNANREFSVAPASGLPACTGARQPARRPAAHRTRRGHRQGDARALFFSALPERYSHSVLCVHRLSNFQYVGGVSGTYYLPLS